MASGKQVNLIEMYHWKPHDSEEVGTLLLRGDESAIISLSLDAVIPGGIWFTGLPVIKYILSGKVREYENTIISVKDHMLARGCHLATSTFVVIDRADLHLLFPTSENSSDGSTTGGRVMVHQYVWICQRSEQSESK
jgi:hypothetical protein